MQSQIISVFLGMVSYVNNPRYLEGLGRGIVASSKPVWDIEWDPVLNNNNNSN